MQPPLSLMAVFAHPDDESLALGPTLARCAAEGIATYLVCATRGQRGWTGAPEADPGPEALGHVREAELREAAQVLGLQEVVLLDYMDGELDRVEPQAFTRVLAAHIRRLRPHVVVTFPPDGAYGHPDHIAVSQHTMAATLYAASSASLGDGDWPPHCVSKVYYVVDSDSAAALYASTALGDLSITVNGVVRRLRPWSDWEITTFVDTCDYWRTAWRAVQCHQSQHNGYADLQALYEQHPRELLGTQTFYRVLSLVNGGAPEHDLFAGLRPEPASEAGRA